MWLAFTMAVFFSKLSVLLLNLYLSFLLLLKFLFEIKWGVGMRFKVMKYYEIMQENGTIEMVFLVSHHHWGTVLSFWCFTSKLV